MAQANSNVEWSFSFEILNPFHVFISKIAQELTSMNVKIIQSVLIDKIPREDLNCININKPNSGVTLISVLYKYRHLSLNNLGLLKELLRLNRLDLLKELEDFEATVMVLDDATKAQMDTLPAPMSVDLYLVVTCKRESLSVCQIDRLKEAMKGTSGLNIVNISYICSRENERDKETTIVTFQFLENPNEQMFAEKLTSSAMKKEAWLAENDVIMLKVNGQPSLNIKENVEFKPKDAEDESILGFNNILSSTPKALEYYRCDHGNDVIELTKSLADHEIPLYIIGIHGDAPTMQPDETLYNFEECLLSGVCHIGGGRYLPILKNEIVPNMNEMISSAIKGDVSIENHGEITGEVFKDALNNHFGDPNVIQLANDLERDLRIKPLKFEKLLQNGRPLEPVTQATERIAFADDLSEAISALERMKEHDPDHNLGIQREVRWYDMELHAQGCAYPVQKGGNIGKGTDAGLPEVDKCPRKSIKRNTIEEGRHCVDLEMAARIVRRHMHRMAYYKKKP
ncbi:hypothetical protein QZH41_020384 [Actinostola sp. cb2023]|nr:hypothetical protein QZH41_020384 [Actinostola sp. cb2023]